MSSDLIDEEWRPISGYVNYQVSNLGQVKNTKTSERLRFILFLAVMYNFTVKGLELVI